MCLTLEEFTEIVKRIFATERILSKERMDAYFEEDETKEIIKEKYEMGVRDVKSGSITDEVFRRGRAGAMAHCLALMY